MIYRVSLMIGAAMLAALPLASMAGLAESGMPPFMH